MPQPWFPDRNTSRAVLIGASAFLSADLPDLPAVAHNLNALEQVLTDPDHGVIGGCGLLADSAVTDTKIGVAIAEAARAATDLLLVYYAGHGVLDDDGRLHLARPDTDVEHIGWTSVSVDLLKRDLGRARARARVPVLDCCFSGRAIAAMANPRSLVTGQLALSGTYILTSTTATAPSHAPPGKRYTSFTNALLGALAQPDPLTLDDIYLRIDSELDSLGLPRPQHNATNNAATLALARGPVLPSIKRPGPAEPLPEPALIAGSEFTVTPSRHYRAGVGIGWIVNAIGVVFGTAVRINSPQLYAAYGIALIGSLMLLPSMVLLSTAKGKLAIAREHLTVQGPLGRRTPVPWSLVHKIRLFEVKQPRRRSPHCKIEIELKESSDGLPSPPFTQVRKDDHPTYEFGEIKTASGMLAAILRQTVGSSTFVEGSQPAGR